jgi:hypothetical protein
MGQYSHKLTQDSVELTHHNRRAGAMKMHSPFDGLRVSRELVCEFFAIFARLEFSLKEMGYLVAERSRAIPDWHRFGEECVTRLKVNSGSALEEAITYLNTEPPQVQMRLNGWQPMQLNGTHSIAKAIDASCRVRHNLFHGGKHSPHSEDGRDQRLVKSALIVLTACIEQNSDLRGIFEQTVF